MTPSKTGTHIKDFIAPPLRTQQPAAEDPEPNAGFGRTATASSAGPDRRTALRTSQGRPGGAGNGKISPNRVAE
jgi:hypothetical protein